MFYYTSIPHIIHASQVYIYHLDSFLFVHLPHLRLGYIILPTSCSYLNTYNQIGMADHPLWELIGMVSKELCFIIEDMYMHTKTTCKEPKD